MSLINRINIRNRAVLIGLAVMICAGVGGMIFGPSVFTHPTEDIAKNHVIPQEQTIPLEEEYLDKAYYVASDELPIQNITDKKSNPQPYIYKDIRIKRGQGMMDTLIKNGADRKNAYKAIKAMSKYYDMRKLQIGQVFQAAYDSDGLLAALNIQKDFDHVIKVARTDNNFDAQLEKLASIKMTRHVEGVIDDSLFLSAYQEGLPDSVIVDLIRIFSFDVDFQREIRKGDKFELFYERKISPDGSRTEEGNILFARLTLSGKPISLYRYKAKESLFTDYFHENGQSAKKALMKTPIEGAHLSSTYGQRKHPVLGYTRMHKGLDFGAPTGTPIMAAGDGIVERASRYGSYGNYVRIRHNDTYKTAYAHMSKYGRGIKAGVRVKQGQIIGYVGATGRVTARHLHYEVLVNNKQVNPLKLKIPTGITLKGKEKKTFLALANDVNQQIDAQKQNILMVWNQKEQQDPALSKASLSLVMSSY